MPEFKVIFLVLLLAFIAGNNKRALIHGSKISEEPVLRVATIVNSPYIYVDDSCIANTTENTQKQNDCYTGFLIDLLKHIRRELSFNYTINSCETEYGELDEENEDNSTGVVRILKDKDADIGLVAFHVTPERQKVIDFSESFLVYNKTSFALGFPKGSNWTSSFSHMIKKLVNQRYIEQLVEVWWNDNPNSPDLSLADTVIGH